MSRVSSLLVVAGEKSGEGYGAALVEAYRALDPQAEFFGVGGEEMKQAGVRLIHRVEELSAVGIFEILTQLPRLRRIFCQLKKEVRRECPQAAVLIDCPDFNLRLAPFLSRLKIPVIYYISPTVWAWRKGRYRTIRRTVHKMLLIFPFEEVLYSRRQIPAVFVGHPLLEKIPPLPPRQEVLDKYGFDPDRPLVALLPGSRETEIRHHLPVLARAVPEIYERCGAQFVLLKAENLHRPQISGFLNHNIPILEKDYYPLLAASDLALSACGTANLEAALLETPFVAFYRLSPLTYALGKPFVHIGHYSIVNILAGSPVVPELIQRAFTPENLTQQTLECLRSKDRRARMLKAFQTIRSSLGVYRASPRAAQEIAALLQPRDLLNPP